MYACKNCSANLKFDIESQMLLCPYCGNSTIVSEHFKKVNTPKYIVPFGITKEECKNKFTKMMKGSVFSLSQQLLRLLSIIFW